MKTAISIPDLIFKDAEKIAKKLRISRSELYTKAIKDFLEIYQSRNITELLNKLYSDNSSSLDKELSNMQFASIEKDDWL